MQLTGYLRNTEKKEGRSARGPWVKYKGEIVSNGSGQKVDWPFNSRPNVTEGDYVTLVANPDAKGFLEVDPTTVQRLEPPKEQPKAQPDARPAQSKAENGAEFNRKTNPEDARRMTYSAAADRAIAFMQLLQAADALPVSKAQTKGGTEKRFVEMNAIRDKLTVEFFNDTLSLRKLDVVADTPPEASGVDKRQELPQAGEESDGPSVDD